MKIYFCVFAQHNYQTGAVIGKTCCVVNAETEDEAKEKAYALCGSDNTAFCSVEEVDIYKGYAYTVYGKAM